MPLTCAVPSLAMTEAGTTLLANARRKMSLNSLSSPPMPIFWKLNSERKMFAFAAAPAGRLVSVIAELGALREEERAAATAHEAELEQLRRRKDVVKRALRACGSTSR